MSFGLRGAVAAAALFVSLPAAAVTVLVDNDGSNPLMIPDCNQDGTGTGSCTLAEAINSINGVDNVEAEDPPFHIINFDGELTIALGADLPTINEPVQISGPSTIECANAFGQAFSAFDFSGAVASPDYAVTDLDLLECSTDDADGGAAIRFLPSGNSTLTASELVITDAVATPANSAGGAIRIGAGHTAVLSNLTITGAEAGERGGAIANEGNLTLTDSEITTSSLSGTGAGAAIASTLVDADGGTVIRRVTFTGNNAGAGNGGAVFATVRITGTPFEISDSTFDTNIATNGGGLSVGFGNVTVSNSTFVSNQAAAAGGAIFLDRQDDGSGTLRNGSVTAENLTLSENTADTGGVLAANSDNATGSSIIFSSFVNNTATTAGGAIGLTTNVASVLPGNAQDPFYKNLFVGNTAGGEAQSCAAALDHSASSSSGSNLADDATCGLTQGTDQQNVAMPGVDTTLAQNNAPSASTAVQTHRLLAGSPAIDGGSDAFDNGADQRGAPTADGLDDNDLVRDIGAYEFAGYSAFEFVDPSISEVENNSPLVAQVRRYGDLALAAQIAVATNDNGTATAGDDYTSASETKSFGVGDAAAQDFSVVLVDDDEVEGDTDETLEIVLDNSANPHVDLGASQPAGASIVDFEEGTFAFSAASYTATEGMDFAVTIDRTAGTDGPVTLRLNSSAGSTNPATADEDYPTITNQAVTFADGEASKQVSIAITDDDAYEPQNETFNLTITLDGDAPANADIGSPATAEVAIESDDAAEVGSVQFRDSDAMTQVNEDNGTVRLGITRTGGDDCGIDVVYSTMDGTATAGSDYTARTNETISFPAGNSDTRTFDIAITDDDVGESNETFSVEIVSATPTNCEDGATAAIGDPGTAVVEITSNEPVNFQFSEASWIVNEADDTVVISVEALQQVTGAEVRIAYETVERMGDDAATADADYTVTTGTLVWQTGESGAMTFEVPIASDTDNAEGNERFDVEISVAQGNAAIVGTNPTPVTIVEQQSVRFTAETFASAVENGGEVAVTVERIGDLTGTASVDIATMADTGDMAATPDTDYDATTQTVSWGAGEGGVRTASFAAQSDNQVEGDETFTVMLTNSQGVDVTTPTSAQAVITDDDSTVRMDASSVSVAEDGGTVTITATREGPTIVAISVDITTLDGDAEAGTDYTALPDGTTLDWDVGESGARSVTVDITDNATIDGDRDFDVVLPTTDNDANVAIGTPASTTVTINDDETQLRFANETVTAAEGSGSVNLVVERTGAGNGAVTVDYAFTSGTATNGADFSLANGTLNWADGDVTDKIITVTILEDARAEDAETLTVTLSNATSTGEPTPVGTPASATVTITDNDAPGIAVTQSDGVTIVREGGPNDGLSIRLNSQPSNDVTVRFDTPSRLRVVTSNPSNDQVLIFNSANWNQPQAVDVIAVDDSAQQGEVTQVLTVRATSTDSRYAGLTSSVSVTIRDNDSSSSGGGGSSGAVPPAMLLVLGGLMLLRRRITR